MKFLFLFLLLTSNSFASYEKVKEVNGIKIPKGITAKKDSLEGGYCITYTKSNHFWYTKPYELQVRLKGTSDNFYMVVDTYYNAIDWIWVDSVTIYVENNETQKYSYKWGERRTSVSDGRVTEYDYTVNKDLEKFLIDNIQKNSKVTIRFHGKSTSTEELTKDVVEKLYSMLQFYQQIQK